MRQYFTVIHRYCGLVMALFLVLAGLTGTLIAFYDELEAILHPELMLVAPAPNQAMLSPITLMERMQKQYPHAIFNRIRLHQEPGKSYSFFLKAAPGLPKSALINDEIFINPYTGSVLGERKWGDIQQGVINLMPFIYRLHFTLALDKVGRYLLGMIALIWTLDCFVGAYLTLPARQRNASITNLKLARQWFQRWQKAWTIRWQAGVDKVNFDWHRASGLWVWAMLFVLAWSSVAFNLREVYNPVMKAVFAKQTGWTEQAKLLKPLTKPTLDMRSALTTGRALMLQLSHKKDFIIRHEANIIYDPSKGIYIYIVNSNLDVSTETANTAVMYSATTGEFLQSYLPTKMTTGDTITEWVMALHTAKVGGLPMQIFVSVMGLIVAGLSITGLYIWLKKRKARSVMKRQKIKESFSN